jgi:hypothetical protein
VISGENELSALEFQKHYRLPIVHLLDPNRAVDTQYNRLGWPFLMLVNGVGKVLVGKTSLSEREMAQLGPLLDKVLGEVEQTKVVTLEGIPYMPATLARSGEMQKAKKRDRFPALACGPKGQVYVLFTREHDGKGDVSLRVFDGKTWLPDRPIAATDADEYDPCVMTDREGRLWVSWTSDREEDKYNILVASLEDPSGSVAAERITDADDDAMHARMACDGEGNVWVTYYRWHKMGVYSRDKEIYVRRWDGKKWSDEVRVSPSDVSPYEDHTDPAIAGLAQGAVIAWSWDYHRPRGYPRTASEPTIVLRTVGKNLNLGVTQVVSGHLIDTTPALAVGSDSRVWCAWDHLRRGLLSRAYRKDLGVRRIDLKFKDPLEAAGRLSKGVVNLCTPCFAVNAKGRVTLIWSETKNGERWVLKVVHCEKDGDAWSDAQVAVSEGNPRFPSAGYDVEGNLWIACSVETERGREVSVKKLPAAN